MNPSLDEFTRSLTECGLMTADEVNDFVKGLPPGEQPGDAQQLAQAMFRRKRLTKFQAQAVYQGKTRGLVMGNYVVLDHLGKGGMGEVYIARHRRMDRVVALKTLPAAATKQESAVKRFRQEVRAAARLVHPNIVTAYDADEDQGVHFLVMEYVAGMDLASLVQEQGPLPVDKAVDCVLQAAKGLQFAHGADVIHRDIKPSNLLADSKGTVKVLDMGLARIGDVGDGDAATVEEGLTRSGEVFGTVDYMPPEQAVNAKDTDARSDIYSLGGTLHYLLTARPMYPGNSLVERILAHRDAPIPSLRDSRPDVPESLDRLFRRMVAKKREDRPQTMAEVIAALEKCPVPSGSPVAAWSAPKGTIGGAPSSSDGTHKANEPTFPASAAVAATVVRSGQSSTDSQVRTVPSPAAAPAKSPPRTYVPPRTTKKKALVKVPLEALWVKAVEQASSVRRSRWPIVKKVLSALVVTAILGAVAGGGYYGVTSYLQNYQRIRQSEKSVLGAVNPQLHAMQIDTLDSLAFSEASAFSGVPAALSFAAQLTRPSKDGRRPVGTIKGSFDRASGVLQLDIEMTDGPGQRGLRVPLSPVP